MDTVYADAQEFAQVFYNIDRTLFRWKAGNMFGHNSYQFRLAMAAWDEIQQDLADQEDYIENPDSLLYASNNQEATLVTTVQKVETHRFIIRNFTYDDLLELRDVVEDEIATRITLGNWDHYSDLPSPEHYKFYAEEEQAR